MRYGLWTKGLVIGITLLCVGAGNITTIKATFDNKFVNNDNSQITNKIINVNNPHKELSSLSDRNVLKENDEGPHRNKIFDMEEWWYYNAYFNHEKSELKNWFFFIGIQLYPTFGGLKIELFNDENESYGGDYFMYLDAIHVYGPGVNVSYKNSSVIGKYPNWHIYAEYTQPDKLEIIVNLTFKAESLPIWLIKNTGHNHSNSFIGYYCVLNCSVVGNISLNGTFYNVSGLGYYDHPWVPLKLKNTTSQNIKNCGKNKLPNLLNIWQWLCIHFDNGWDMFVGKIYSEKRYLFSTYGPGNICFTTSGEKFDDIYFFLIQYEETKNSTIPGIVIPTKVHIKAFFLSTIELKHVRRLILLDFYYEAKNIRNDTYGNPPSYGYWISQGNIYGSVKTLGITIPLKGWAVMETTSGLIS